MFPREKINFKTAEEPLKVYRRLLSQKLTASTVESWLIEWNAIECAHEEHSAMLELLVVQIRITLQLKEPITTTLKM